VRREEEALVERGDEQVGPGFGVDRRRQLTALDAAPHHLDDLVAPRRDDPVAQLAREAGSDEASPTSAPMTAAVRGVESESDSPRR
jgi:hypothetical protein